MSETKSLDTLDWKNWLTNLRVFFTPVALMYLVPIVAILQTPNHIISGADFIPTAVTIGAILLYIMNALIDLLRKYYQGPVPTVPAS